MNKERFIDDIFIDNNTIAIRMNPNPDHKLSDVADITSEHHGSSLKEYRNDPFVIVTAMLLTIIFCMLVLFYGELHYG